jgi:hypothetical protein
LKDERRQIEGMQAKAERRDRSACLGALALVLVCGWWGLGAPVRAQSGVAAGNAPGYTLSAGPKELAEDAVANELKLIQFQHSYLRYRVHTKDAKGDQVRDVIESKDGTVARVVLRSDRALTTDEDAREHARLQAMLDSPSAFEKHIQKDVSGKKTATDLVKMMPEAMTFSFVPGQPQREHKPAGTAAEYVLDFKPNPKWNPPTMTSQALTGIEGRCWIDAKTHHLTRLEATIFQGVNFGYGIFGHIFPGGQLTLEQEQVGEQRWMVDRFIDQLTMRVVVKTLKESTDWYAFEFSPVKEMGYQEAIHVLLATPLPGSGVTASK